MNGNAENSFRSKGKDEQEKNRVNGLVPAYL